ncbi:hypothetical protein ACFLSQ_09870 [Bacteroidota bacterium]
MADNNNDKNRNLYDDIEQKLINAKKYVKKYEMTDSEIDELHANVIKQVQNHELQAQKKGILILTVRSITNTFRNLLGFSYGFAITPQLVTVSIIFLICIGYGIFTMIPENKQNDIAGLSKPSLHENGYERHQEREIIPEGRITDSSDLGKPSLYELGYERHQERETKINQNLLAKLDLNDEAYQPPSFSLAKSKSISINEALIEIKNVLKENNFTIRSESSKAVVTEWKKISINGKKEATRLKVTSDANKNLIEFYIEKKYKVKDDKIILSKNYYKEIFDKINESLKK